MFNNKVCSKKNRLFILRIVIKENGKIKHIDIYESIKDKKKSFCFFSKHFNQSKNNIDRIQGHLLFLSTVSLSQCLHVYSITYTRQRDFVLKIPKSWHYRMFFRSFLIELLVYCRLRFVKQMATNDRKCKKYASTISYHAYLFLFLITGRHAQCEKVICDAIWKVTCTLYSFVLLLIGK